jgi:hypothetical protein
MVAASANDRTLKPKSNQPTDAGSLKRRSTDSRRVTLGRSIVSRPREIVYGWLRSLI